jgi:hypothetical protein
MKKMQNDGYELSSKYYKNLNRTIVIILVGFVGGAIGFIGWYVLENTLLGAVLSLIGFFIVALAIAFGFITFFYAAYLFIRLLFAKWPRRD